MERGARGGLQTITVLRLRAVPFDSSPGTYQDSIPHWSFMQQESDRESYTQPIGVHTTGSRMRDKPPISTIQRLKIAHTLSKMGNIIVGIFTHVSSNHKCHTTMVTQEIKDSRRIYYDGIDGTLCRAQHKRSQEAKPVQTLPSSLFPFRYYNADRLCTSIMGNIRFQIGNTYEHMELTHKPKTIDISMEALGNGTK
jgi:hypothetical protein